MANAYYEIVVCPNCGTEWKIRRNASTKPGSRCHCPNCRKDVMPASAKVAA